MTAKDSNQTKALLATILCHVLWGFSFMASRTALNHGTVFQLLSHRFLAAFLLMNLVLLSRRVRVDLKNKPVGLLLLLGLMEPVVYFIGEQYGILHSSTIFSGVMIAMIPIAATFAAAPFLGEKPTAGQLVFSLLSVGGVIGIGLLSRSSGTLDWIGLISLVIAVAAASAYSLLSRSLSDSFSPFERAWAMLGLGAVIFTGIALFQVQGNFSAYLAPLREPAYLGAILYLAPIASVVCYFFSGYALTYLSVARESVFSNLTTAVSVFAGAVLLKEPFSWLSLVCCALILFGIWGVQRTSPE
ncbi:MAG: DMT family transporter [Lachnospiraceae bacterium]|nr:DMT family transporter [Lachnospiraceae bacterium]